MLTPKQLLDAGFHGSKLGGLIKKSKKENWTEEEIAEFLITKECPERETTKVVLDHHTIFHFIDNSPELSLHSSKSELKRWFADGVIEINGEKAEADDLYGWYLPFKSIVFFPEGKTRKTTLL